MIAYSHPYVNEVESGLAHGCSPWGASTIAGSKGERVPTRGELEVAVHQGKVSNVLSFEVLEADNRCLPSLSVPT
jgi:multimeric flavodoxin WrbA